MVLNEKTKAKINKCVKNAWPKNIKEIDILAKAFISIDSEKYYQENKDKPNFKNEFKE